MGIESPVHLLFIAVVALIVLGPKRLPGLARALGQGIREFRGSLEDGASQPEPSDAPPAAATAVAPTAVAAPLAAPTAVAPVAVTPPPAPGTLPATPGVSPDAPGPPAPPATQAQAGEAADQPAPAPPAQQP